jgi:MinD-like ATPase involved in chromosome partitioning or flagellar assembly
MDGAGRVVGVVGARGGVGATTLAAALASALATLGDRRAAGPPPRRAAIARTGARWSDGRPGVALVDLDGAGAGLDVHLGIEDAGGLRWADLSDARGEVPGVELAALLPTWSGVVVLSGDRWRPGPAPPDVVADVLDALVGCHHVVVVDLGRREVLEGGPGPRRCDTVLVVSGRDVVSVAGVVALRDPLRDVVADVRLVVGGPAPGGLGPLEVAHVVDLPVAATLPVDRRLPGLVERGVGPVVRGRGALARRLAALARDVA